MLKEIDGAVYRTHQKGCVVSRAHEKVNFTLHRTRVRLRSSHNLFQDRTGENRIEHAAGRARFRYSVSLNTARKRDLTNGVSLALYAV